MNKFLYESSRYTVYRPSYPENLFEFLRKLSRDCDLVLDCGCGSGQAALSLSRYFKKVIATDLSFELLSQAAPNPTILYVQSKADQLPIRSKSINLICVAQALHWFATEAFYNEVKRILLPNGIIAAWGYNQSTINPAIDQLINEIYAKISDPNATSIERQYLYDHYQTMPFPFERISSPNFVMEVKWTLPELLGYISTWPGLLEYKRRFDVDLLADMEVRFLKVWGDPLEAKMIKWPIYLLIGRFQP